MKYWLIVIAALSIVSCNTEADKKNNPDLAEGDKKSQAKDSSDINIDIVHEVVDELEMDNGIKIKWFTRGEGKLIASGDMIEIDYKVYLEDGKIVDGNHIHDIESVPFMVGFQMQTIGWDLALKKMKIGDFVEIYLPASQARGDKEIKGLIPKNSPNIIKIHVMDLMEPDRVVDGNRVWLMTENKANTEVFDETKRVLFHCWVSTPTNPFYYNSEWANNPYNFGLGDQGLVPGLRKALINAKKADIMFVHIPAEEAYGSAGYQDIVKPNEDLLYRLFVMEVRDK